VNTVIGILTLITKKEKPGRMIVNNPDLEKCKIASMQLFAGLNRMMELLEGKGKWNKNCTKFVIKAMEKEKERLTPREGLAMGSSERFKKA